ncbi:restriction endonuclease subunit S [Dolichospermum compactum]|uniref:Restriction modification system DNA specificity domain protein n=1 Tax=Dolichospermum compactum NIES-806 TaxID=1973481 RepID=A0A1Z4UYK9_9CYAN|nr:restriction endonuclease subunit S [Dolichospermum compactum]BAZ84165.1 restriction modification system DNA specificity domain protein [Dolichospermum compactum NIES-806]
MDKIELPPSWKSIQLGQVVSLQRGKDLPKTERQTGVYPVVGSNGIVGYHSEFMSHGPGVMVGRSGSVGKITWIECYYWALNTSLYVKNFHGNDPLFIRYFLSYLKLGKYASGVSVPK